MRVVIAPDSFKGTATAAAVARAIAAGWRSVRPDDDVVTAPMADGGEGTLDAFAAAYPASRRRELLVPGPDDRPVRTTWLALPDGRAVVELAAASGITLLDRLRPDTAHTLGFGRTIASALDERPNGLVLGIGGSASTDGGLGVLVALGLRINGDPGGPLFGTHPLGAAGLDAVRIIDTTGLRPLPPDGAVVLGDVDSPLLGPSGAAAVFGPQKGVAPDEVCQYDRRLAHWASCFPNVDPTTPGAGAAGGTGFALLAWGARITPGAVAIADALGLPEALIGCDLVVTGEGRYDGQSAAGKVPETIRRLSGGAEVALIAGAVDAPTDAFVASIALRDLAAARGGDPEGAMRRPLYWAGRAGAQLALRER